MEELGFDKICRSCRKEKQNLLNIFYTDEDEPNLAEKFASCTSISMNSSDLLPQHICYPCTKQLDVAYQFYTQCFRANEEFLNILKKAGHDTSTISKGEKTATDKVNSVKTVRHLHEDDGATEDKEDPTDAEADYVYQEDVYEVSEVKPEIEENAAGSYSPAKKKRKKDDSLVAQTSFNIDKVFSADIGIDQDIDMSNSGQEIVIPLDRADMLMSTLCHIKTQVDRLDRLDNMSTMIFEAVSSIGAKTQCHLQKDKVIYDSHVQLPALPCDRAADVFSLNSRLEDSSVFDQMVLHLKKYDNEKATIKVRVRNIMDQLITLPLMNQFTWTGKASCNDKTLTREVFKNKYMLHNVIQKTLQYQYAIIIGEDDVINAIKECLRRASERVKRVVDEK